jgi:hypothetical protein
MSDATTRAEKPSVPIDYASMVLLAAFYHPDGNPYMLAQSLAPPAG